MAYPFENKKIGSTIRLGTVFQPHGMTDYFLADSYTATILIVRQREIGEIDEPVMRERRL